MSMKMSPFYKTVWENSDFAKISLDSVMLTMETRSLFVDACKMSFEFTTVWERYGRFWRARGASLGAETFSHALKQNTKPSVCQDRLGTEMGKVENRDGI
jgi:hypothetical protein